jgi:ribonuclease Z
LAGYKRPFDVTIIGCGAAMPTEKWGATSQAINLHGHWLLMDAGEGTQQQLRKQKIPFQRIEAILISHLHGDHFLGLPGLLGTMNLLGRKSALTIVGPPRLASVLAEVQSATGVYLNFPVKHVAFDETEAQVVWHTDTCEVRSFPVRHRISTCGYAFRERGVSDPRTYIFSADTQPSETLAEEARGADLLYHEATFLEILRARAKETGHSTALQAGEVARSAGVKNLILGHFSTRYRNPEVLVDEARSSFEQVRAASKGTTYQLLGSGSIKES